MSDYIFPRRMTRREFPAASGAADGKFNTCHGGEPEVYSADRQNIRIQVFDLALNHKRNLVGTVRNPCCFYQNKNYLYFPDVASRVTILDADAQLAAYLGDGKEADGKTNRPEYQTNPALFAAPHALTVDSKGDL
jgi:hypothetical protein